MSRAPTGRDGSPPERPAPRRPLVLGWLTLLALLHGLLWMAIIPPWQTPDEPKHFEYVRLLAASDRVIAFATEADAADLELQREILASMDANRFWWYARAPGYDSAAPPTRFEEVWLQGMHTAFYRSSPIYYWLVSLTQPAGLIAGLYLARLVSVLLGVLVVLLTGAVARELFPDDPLVRYGAPAFVALSPMFAAIHAGVNSDALVNALTALTFFLLARLWVRGLSLARLVLIGLVVALAVATKRTAVFLVPTTILALLLWWAARFRRLALVLSIGAGLTLAIAAVGWAWWSSGGAESIPQAWRWTALRYFFNEPDQPARIVETLRAPGVRAELVRYIVGLHGSFWGSFGWHIADLPSWLYAILAGIGLVAALGLAFRAARGQFTRAQLAAVVTFAAAVGIAAAGATAFFASYLPVQAYPPPPQGRYLIAAIGPIAVLLTTGLGAWVRPDLRPRALMVFVAGMVVLDLAALLGVVVPYYYR